MTPPRLSPRSPRQAAGRPTGTPLLRSLRHPAPVLAVLVCGLTAAAVVVPPAAFLVLAVIALVVGQPLLRALAGGAAWTVPLLAGVAFLVADTAGRSNAPGAGRYLPTLLVVVVILLVGARPDGRSTALRTTACLLFAYGLLGTMYGRVVLGTVDGTLPLIGPMLIACLPPVRNWDAAPRWRLGLRTVSVGCAMLALFAGLARLGVLPASQLAVVNHEKAGIMLLGVAAALAARDRIMTIASTAALVFAFLIYPAATYVIAAAAFVGTVVLARWMPNAGQRLGLAIGGTVTTMLAILHIDYLVELSGIYFELVGKDNNGETRVELYRAALDQLERPLFSEFFTGEITVVGTFVGHDEVAPVHNDYLSVMLGGGLVASALLLAVFMYANGLVVRTLPQLQDGMQRRALIVLLGAINAAAVSAFANPVFMNPGTSAVTFALLAGLVAACRLPAPDDGAAHGAEVRSSSSTPPDDRVQRSAELRERRRPSSPETAG